MLYIYSWGSTVVGEIETERSVSPPSANIILHNTICG